MQEIGKITIGFVLFVVIVSAVLEIAPELGSFRPNLNRSFGDSLAEKPSEITTTATPQPIIKPVEIQPTPTRHTVEVTATPTAEIPAEPVPTQAEHVAKPDIKTVSGCIEKPDRSAPGQPVTYGFKQAQADGLIYSYGVGGSGTQPDPYQYLVYTNCRPE